MKYFHINWEIMETRRLYKYKFDELHVHLYTVVLVAGKGVDLILDCVGASYYEKNIKSVRLEGRWVIYGLLGNIDYLLLYLVSNLFTHI